MEYKYTKEELLMHLKTFLEVAPSKTTEIFFYGLLSCIYPFVNYPIESVLVVQGKHGTMKTSTTRIIADAEIKFQTIKNFNEDYKACVADKKKVLLIDDIFPRQMRYNQEKQAELLNDIARQGDREMANIGIIFTMESLPKLLASGRSRIWLTKFPTLYDSADVIEKKWKTLVTLPKQFISEMMTMYQDILENRREEVKNYIENFLSNFELPKELNYSSSRIPIHMKNLLLSEELFHRFFVDGNTLHIYDRAKYKESLIKSAYLQQQEVISAEKSTDLVRVTYNVLSSKKYLTKCELCEYKPNGSNYTHIRKGFIMVSNSALRAAINKYLNRTITSTSLDKALMKEGVIEPEGSKATKSTSQYGCRHFYVDLEALAQYMKINYYNDDAEEDVMMVDVIRKK